MKKKIYNVGYTTGVFDLFHVGHLNVLRKSKELCNNLVVGITTDELTIEMKDRKPIIPFSERQEIVKSIKYVDEVVPKVTNDNILDVWETLRFDVLFKGDDWKNTEKGLRLENELKKIGVQIHYFPYTKETSSSIIRSVLDGVIHR